ncbi:MAG: diguanylate cyclase [Spirochaetales bacterium]|nr:diguanylate cyclase [Spirochaetales bacterium]
MEANYIGKARTSGLSITRPGILLLFIFFSSLLLSGCGNDEDTISAVRGVLDLRSLGSLSGEIVELKGEWAFFWDEFAEIDNLVSYPVAEAAEFMDLPSYWSPHRRGYAVYSLRILLPADRPEQLALKMSNVLENYSLYSDGVLLYTAGKPGKSSEDSVAESIPSLIPLRASGQWVDLVIQVSNWKDVVGGLSRKIHFGDYQSLKSYRERYLALDALILGAVLIIGIYHLAAFALTHLHRPNPPYFFLGLTFLLMALFIGSKDELIFVTLFPDFSAALRSAFIHTALISSISFFFCYIYFVFSELFPKIIFRLILIFSCLIWLLIVVTDRAFYTRFLIPFEIYNMALSLYIAVKLVCLFVRKKDAVVLAYLAGYLLLICGIIFGILDNILLVPAWSPAIVFFGFTLYQTVLQAHVTADYIRKINQLNTAFLEMEKETEKLYDLSYIDPLTSIANRRYLNDYMQKLWDRNSITEVQIGMIIIDIDYFKLYNDRYGHLSGDSCLVKVSTRLKELINRKGDFISRYGGEEFVAIFQNCPSAELCLIAERLRAGIEELGIEHLDSQCSVSVTVSAGVSEAVPERGSTWLRLFKTADDALYRAKEGGRNRVES